MEEKILVALALGPLSIGALCDRLGLVEEKRLSKILDKMTKTDANPAGAIVQRQEGFHGPTLYCLA